MGATTSSPHHEPLGRAHHSHINGRNTHLRSSMRSPGKDRGGVGGPRRMDRLRRSLRDSFRRRKEHVPESSKPHVWQADETAVRAGTCNFHVKYLGCVEVFESRGMQVCEEALKVLRNSRRRPVKAILHVSGDGLRVVEDDTKGLIVDQTIEKVSFCAPDRNHEKGFSYICRDGTTRRWMCHGFLALKESGERLSHAVGCAFAACLERKQKRDKECGVTMTFDSKNSTFTRTGSFRQASITERLQDPQDCKPTEEWDWNATLREWDQPAEAAAPIVPPQNPYEIQNTAKEPPPVKPVHNPFAIERPHATPSMLQRQGSFRGFTNLSQASPFKRQLSLRISDLPSNIERQRSQSLEGSSDLRAPPRPQVAVSASTTSSISGVSLPPSVSPQPPPRTQRNRLHSLPNAINMSPIPEASPISDKTDPVSAMCQQLSQGLSLLSTCADDPFPSERPSLGLSTALNSQLSTASQSSVPQPSSTNPPFDPIKFYNPWMNDTPRKPTSTSATITTPAASSILSNTATPSNHVIASVSSVTSPPAVPSATTTTTVSWGAVSTSTTLQGPTPSGGTTAISTGELSIMETTTTTLSQGLVDVAGTTTISPEALPKPDQWLGSLTASPLPMANNAVIASGNAVVAPSPPRRAPHLAHLRAHSLGSAEPYMGPTKGYNRNDPFDAEWAAMAARNAQQASTNPFAQGAVKAFEVQM